MTLPVFEKLHSLGCEHETPGNDNEKADDVGEGVHTEELHMAIDVLR